MTKDGSPLKRMEKELRKMDPNVKPGSREWDAALVMLAALHVGPNVRRIVAFTKIPETTVRGFAHELRRNQIWQGGRIRADWSGEDGGIAFWMDVCCALGLVKRTSAATP